MAGLTIICLSDIEPLSETEIEAELLKEKAQHKKKLLEICPSKKMRRRAKRISKRNNSCDKCVFCDGESIFCYVLYSDFYMEDLDIDPCYEGVLRYLAAKRK